AVCLSSPSNRPRECRSRAPSGLAPCPSDCPGCCPSPFLLCTQVIHASRSVRVLASGVRSPAHNAQKISAAGARLRGERSYPAAARYDDERCGIITITLQPLDDNESCSGTQGF